MGYELDHIFILVSKDAPEAQLLIDFGLTEGPSRVHHGQGTANRCFYFNNVVLELLWVYDECDAQNEVTTPTTLWPRWNQSRTPNNNTASAFGLCIRSDDAIEKPAPFKAWKYQPDLFPKPMYVSIADTVTDIEQPFIFYSPMARRMAKKDKDRNNDPIRDHKIGFRKLTSTSLNTIRHRESSESINALIALKIIYEKIDLYHKIELQFDGAFNGRIKDFSPALPLIIRW